MKSPSPLLVFAIMSGEGGPAGSTQQGPHEVHVWWKHQNASTLLDSDVAGQLFVTDVIIYCGMAVLDNGTVGAEPAKPGSKPGSSGWGQPELCPAAIDAAAAAGLGVQVILEQQGGHGDLYLKMLGQQARAFKAGTPRVARKTDDSDRQPFYADPLFDSAHDAEFVWSENEQTWWILYLQNRYNVPAVEPAGPCPYCSYTDIGLASTPDNGTTWIYRGVARGLDVPLDLRHDPTNSGTQQFGGATWYRPAVIKVGLVYHGFWVYWEPLMGLL